MTVKTTTSRVPGGVSHFQQVQQNPSERAPDRTRLSRRQEEVAEFVARGLCDCEIGAVLGLSENTVGAYLNDIFKRYGLHTRTALASAFLQTQQTGAPAPLPLN